MLVYSFLANLVPADADCCLGVRDIYHQFVAGVLFDAWQNCISPVSRCATSSDDKNNNHDEQKSEFWSRLMVVSSDDDETGDFVSVADTSSSHQLNTSASADKKESLTECASVNGNIDQHYKSSFFTATSPASVRSPPSSTNSQYSASVPKMSLSWSSNTQTTGDVFL